MGLGLALRAHVSAFRYQHNGTHGTRGTTLAAAGTCQRTSVPSRSRRAATRRRSRRGPGPSQRLARQDISDQAAHLRSLRRQPVERQISRSCHLKVAQRLPQMPQPSARCPSLIVLGLRNRRSPRMVHMHVWGVSWEQAVCFGRCAFIGAGLARSSLSAPTSQGAMC